MVQLRGADLEALANIKVDIERQANTLQLITNAATAGVTALNRIWEGPDSHQFQRLWQTQHRPALNRAIADLSAAAATIERNRRAQEVVSDGVAGGTGVLGDANSPRPKPTPEEILEEYQVEDGEMVEWKPKLGRLPFRAFWMAPQTLTQKEADLLDWLADGAQQGGVLALHEFRDIRDLAFDESELRYAPTLRHSGLGVVRGNFDHTDAYRHAYWSALLTAEYGAEFASDFTDAHEGAPGNLPDVEAMDLFNNEVGIRLARENPGASREELADLVFEAVENGETVLLNQDSELAYSDQVPVGETGVPDAGDLVGVPHLGDDPDPLPDGHIPGPVRGPIPGPDIGPIPGPDIGPIPGPIPGPDIGPIPGPDLGPPAE